MNEPKKYLVIDLNNGKYLYATSKTVISNNTGIHRNSLIDMEERRAIKGYYIITLKKNKWI